MSNEDSSYLKRRLLSSPPPPPPTYNSLTFENEMGPPGSGSGKKGGSGDAEPEPDFRLHDAVCESDNLEEVRQLMRECPSLLFVRDDEGRSPLHILAISGDEGAPEIAETILGMTEDKEAILSLTDDKGYTPLHYAAKNWFPELTQVFLKHGAKASAQANDKENWDTPFHLACEGDIDVALDCVKTLLTRDKDGTLINTKNRNEHTGLHRAIQMQASEMVKLLLQPENKLDLSSQTLTLTQKGQNVLQFLCNETGETEKSCKILKTLSDACTATQLNGVDQEGRSVLHTAAILRLPRITEILVGDERMDVLRVDQRQRLALHYASENGSYPDGYACVERLISKTFSRTKTQIQYLYEMNDDSGSSCFMLACMNCPKETIHKYLEAVKEPQFWMTDTNMTLVYKRCPLAIKALMDGAFTERKKWKSTEMDVIVADFGPITGYNDPVEELPQQETKYLKNALFWDYESQKTILMHPLTQLFVTRKCQKLQSIIYGWILWQLIWLLAYTLLILTTYCDVINSPTTALLSSILILIYIVVSFFNEIFEFCSVGVLSYARSWSNYFQVFQIALALVAISAVLLKEEPSTLQDNCAATGILLAYILSMRDIGKMHEEIGLVVEVLKQVVVQIVKVLICCSPLLVGFTLTFLILFENDDSFNTTFPGPLLKVLVMMTGEFEYNETFKDENPDDAVKAKHNRAFKLLLFMSFLICVPVAFFNLLTGFALERVMELRERAKVGRIAKQLEHIHFIESILLSLRPLRKLLPHGKLARMLRKYNVTTALIDGDLKFETFLHEEMRKKVDRKFAVSKPVDLCNSIRSMFGTELNPEVRHEIFALASKNSHKKQQ